MKHNSRQTYSDDTRKCYQRFKSTFSHSFQRFIIVSSATPNPIHAFNYTYCRGSMHSLKMLGVSFHLIWTAKFKTMQMGRDAMTTQYESYSEQYAWSGKYSNAFFLYRNCSSWDWLRNQNRISQCIAMWKITSRNMCNSFSIWSVQLFYRLFKSLPPPQKKVEGKVFDSSAPF